MPLSAKWKKTMDDGMKSPVAHIWDGIVFTETNSYNQRLKDTPGFVWVDPTVILAMLWVESGPLSSWWTTRPMQIGNPRDPGWKALKDKEGTTSDVASPALLKAIESAKPGDLDKPDFNIRAGMAYLFMRMSISDEGSIQDARDTSVHTHVVAAGETATSIAKHEGTTVEVLRAMNSKTNINVLHAGQLLFFIKAHLGRKITGWRSFDPATIAKQYNVGDSNYAEKLRYVLGKWSGN